MNKFLLFLTALGLSPLTSEGQIAVGTSNPEPSAAFEVYSTTKGFLPPRMTQVQLTSISSPVEGLLIYCTDCIIKGLYIHNGTDFVNTLTGNSLNFYLLLNEIVEESTNPASNGVPTLDQLTNIGITGMTESQTYYEEAIADASPNPTTLEELQNIIQIANITLPPIINSGSTANDLVENTGPEQEVYTIIAYDLIGIESYSIDGTDSSAFTIDVNSGVVTLIENPDFETQAIYSFNVSARDEAGNSSAPKNVTLSITDLDDEAPVITSPATANTISVNSGAGQEIYTVTASDNVGVTSYGIAGTDASAFTINPNTGVVTLKANPNYDKLSYSFEVTASDILNNPCIPLTVSLTIDSLVAWGQTRYIMFRGIDGNGLYNNIGEVDILDSLGINLIDNGVLDKNNFTYRYGGGYYSNSSGVDLFDDTPSDAYANGDFSNSSGQKWILVDLGQTVEIGSLTIQARSNSTDHINRISHMTVFTSDRDDTGFKFTGTPSGDLNEDLVLGTTIDQMKLDPALKWRDLDGYSTGQTSNNYTKGNQIEDTIAPVITSPATAYIDQYTGSEQVIYTITATDNVGVASYSIEGTDASAFTIDQTTGVITLAEPNFDIENFYTFKVTVSDFSNNTKSLIVSINNEEGFVTWGQTRYIMFRGTDENGLYNNIGELDILDSLGINLIDNGVLDKNNFTYRYGGGYYSNSSGVDLFDDTPSDAYANGKFSNSSGQKWILVDLGQTVEIGSLTIQARTNSSSHIDRITHMTVFTSDINDTGFTFTGTPSGGLNEDLVLGNTIDQMKLYPSLKWRDLDNYSTSQTSIKYTAAYKKVDTILPVITSPAIVSVKENIGSEQIIYTATASDNLGVASYMITGTDALEFTIEQNTGKVTLKENPNFETKNSYTFEITATDIIGNPSEPYTVNLQITDVDEVPPVITSGLVANDVISINRNAGEVIYTVEATDNVAVDRYYFSGSEYFSSYSLFEAFLSDDGVVAISLSMSTITGEITFIGATDYSNLPITINFSVTATDQMGNISEPINVSFTLRDIEYTIGETRYIMLRGIDDNGPSINIGELEIFDLSGANLIENGSLIKNDFTYNYGGGFSPNESGTNLFNNLETGYTNNSSLLNEGENWVLIDLGQKINIDVLQISARSNNQALIDRINHVTVFTSDRDDTGFSYSGITTGDGNEDLTLGRTINQMKADTTLNWFNLDNFSTQNPTLIFVEPSIGLSPIITSANSADNIIENSGAGQLVYTAEVNDIEIASFTIDGIDANEFTIDQNTGEVYLVDNPDYEVKSNFSFEVTAKDTYGNTSEPHIVDLQITDEDDSESTWGRTRYILLMGKEGNGLLNIVGKLKLFDQSGNKLIDGLTLISSNFKYNYGGGYVTNSSGEKLFKNNNSYTSRAFSKSEGEKWVLIELNETVEIGSINVETNQNNINAISHMTMFVSENNSALNFNGSITNNSDEDLRFNKTIIQMKADTSLKWVDLDEFSTDQTSINYSKAMQIGDSIPLIISAENANPIEENSGAGQEVYTVIAIDKLEVSSYDILGTDAIAFTIDENTGVVTLKDNPDFETQESYSFEVTASDAEGNTSVPKIVSLAITDIEDEEAPVITSANSANPITENSGPGQEIYTVTASDNEDINSYAISGTDSGAFTFDTITGVVTLKDNPNFETQESYSFEVTASDAQGNTSEPKIVSLAITDIEDEEAPVVTSANTANEIASYSGAGQEIYTITASDNAGIASYAISGTDSSAFTVNTNTGVVTLIVNPDFATQESYNFEVTATDATGNTSVPKIVSLAITDIVDEEAPVITSANTAHEIVSFSGAGQEIYTITASDNAGIASYAISGTDSSAFTVNTNTGVVTLIADPNHETKNMYSFQVFAKDAQGNSSEAKTVTLEIFADIIHPDEEPPVINSANSANPIASNSGAGQEIYTVTASDNVGVTNYAISGTDSSAFMIDETTGVLTLIENPDFATQETYNFEVTASDAEGNKSTPQTVSLSITEFDQEAPVITSSSVANPIEENSGSGQHIYTITGIDNIGIVRFDIQGTDGSQFLIIPSTGNLLFTQNPNFETQETYNFDVTAIDAAGNTSIPHNVSFSIIDIEDEDAPVITSTSFANPIEENSGAGQEIYTITGIDNFGIVRFNIQGQHANAFTIDENTGVLTLIGNPDFETQGTYRFEVTATDATGNTSVPHSVSLSITNIEDEIIPFITSASVANPIEEYSGAGQEIYTVTAGDNVGITNYAISGTDSSEFTIDETTGVVTLIENPDFAIQETYTFKVTASDAAGNTSTPLTINLSILELDEEAPVITSGSVANPIVENSGSGQHVYTITGIDNVGIVRFDVQGTDNGEFTINHTSGFLHLYVNPNFETKDTYNFEVTATDAAGNISTPQTVSLSITEIEDEESPVITSDSVANPIEEYSGAGQEIYTVTASDNIGITNYAISGTHASAFTIDETTGVVTLTENPDFATQETYNFEVTASDAAGNTSEPHNVSFSITYLDLEAPVIISANSANSVAIVSDSLFEGLQVFNVHATDNTGVTSYTLGGIDANAFQIDTISGIVTLIDDPNSTNKESYTFEVIAWDAAGNASTPQTINLSIAGIDDEEAPVITSAALADTITENSGQGHIIYNVTTSNDAAIECYNLIVEGEDKSIVINNDNGLVYLNLNPNYETKQTHTFGVYVRDTLGNIGPILEVTLEVRRATKWGPVRYVMLRGADSLYLALNQLNIFDSLGNNLINNFSLDINNFTYRYGGGYETYTSTQSAENLFANTDRFQSAFEITEEKWLLIDLGQEIEIGYFEIQGVYSDNPAYHESLNRTTLFTSTRDDTGFAYTGQETNDSTEDLHLGSTIDEMKADSTLKWQDIKGFTLWSNPELDMIFNNPNR